MSTMAFPSQTYAQQFTQDSVEDVRREEENHHKAANPETLEVSRGELRWVATEK